MIVAAHATTPRKGERREGGNRRDASKGDANGDSRCFFLAPNKNARRKTKRGSSGRETRANVASRSAAPGDDTLERDLRR